jgi:hypothetical protein
MAKKLIFRDGNKANQLQIKTATLPAYGKYNTEPWSRDYHPIVLIRCVIRIG